MIVVFIVDGDFEHVYFTTTEKYSQVLQKSRIDPDRVVFKTVPMESLALILDGQLDFVVR